MPLAPPAAPDDDPRRRVDRALERLFDLSRSNRTHAEFCPESLFRKPDPGGLGRSAVAVRQVTGNRASGTDSDFLRVSLHGIDLPAGAVWLQSPEGARTGVPPTTNSCGSRSKRASPASSARCRGPRATTRPATRRTTPSRSRPSSMATTERSASWRSSTRRPGTPRTWWRMRSRWPSTHAGTLAAPSKGHGTGRGGTPSSPNSGRGRATTPPGAAGGSTTCLWTRSFPRSKAGGERAAEPGTGSEPIVR